MLEFSNYLIRNKKRRFFFVNFNYCCLYFEMTGLAIIVPIINSFLEIENHKRLNLFGLKNFINFSDISISLFY